MFNWKEFLSRNYLWMVLIVLDTGVVYFFWHFLGQSDGIKAATYIGIAYLVLTLVPNNLIRWAPLSWRGTLAHIARYKRDFGITAGLLFVMHGLLAVISLNGLNTRFLFSKPILFALVASTIFELMLITGNAWSVRYLKTYWKKLHSFVWFALPFALVHSVLASQLFTGDWSKVGVIGLGGLIVFVAWEAVMYLRYPDAPGANTPLKWRHAKMVIGGILLALAIFVLYPQRKVTSTPTSPTTTANQLATTAEKTFTMTELSQHNTGQSCYISYQGNVYDITTFLPVHPGGEAEATQKCGQSVDDFTDLHPGGSFSSKDVQKVLGPRKIGVLQ